VALVAGIDSSTQSTKVVLCQAEDGTVVGTHSAPHPAGTECDPEAWWAALKQAGDGLLDKAAAIAGEIARGALLAAGTGDNMAGALGLGLTPG
jgi:xylulokinase